MKTKSTPEQIRQRFDADVERFSNLSTGQSATIDSPLCMDLIATAAAAMLGPRESNTPVDILDIGCGAGNYTLKLLEKLALHTRNANCTLVDLSRPMLDRAVERIRPQSAGTIRQLQGDMRELDMGRDAFDIILTASTLHHLRTDDQWHAMFANMHAALRPGGTLWIFDLLEHAHPAINALMRERYGQYLSNLKGGGEAGEAYRQHVFDYVEAEDTPRSLMFQLALMQQVGFTDLEILHKNVCFAAFGGRKA